MCPGGALSLSPSCMSLRRVKVCEMNDGHRPPQERGDTGGACPPELRPVGEFTVASGWHSCVPVPAVETQAHEELGRGQRGSQGHRAGHAAICRMRRPFEDNLEVLPQWLGSASAGPGDAQVGRGQADGEGRREENSGQSATRPVFTCQGPSAWQPWLVVVGSLRGMETG